MCISAYRRGGGVSTYIYIYMCRYIDVKIDTDIHM